MANYVLAQLQDRSQIDNEFWFVMEAADLAALESEQSIAFGCMAYIIKAGTVVIFGNDGKWYDNTGSEVSAS